MELRLRLRIFRLECGWNWVHKISRPALNPLSYPGSWCVQVWWQSSQCNLLSVMAVMSLCGDNAMVTTLYFKAPLSRPFHGPGVDQAAGD